MGNMAFHLSAWCKDNPVYTSSPAILFSKYFPLFVCKAVLEHISCFSWTGSFIQLIPRETPPPSLATKSERYSGQYRQQAGDEPSGWLSGLSVASTVRKVGTRCPSSWKSKKKPSLENPTRKKEKKKREKGGERRNHKPCRAEALAKKDWLSSEKFCSNIWLFGYLGAAVQLWYSADASGDHALWCFSPLCSCEIRRFSSNLKPC